MEMASDRWLSQAKRGLLELCVLNLLATEGMYGYQLVQRLAARPGLVVTEGTVYPLLTRLRREGIVAVSLVESPRGPVRKVYGLTPEGEQRRLEATAAWHDLARAISGIIKAADEAERGKGEA
jgi:PadR family transcriptional regulator PadR